MSRVAESQETRRLRRSNRTRPGVVPFVVGRNNHSESEGEGSEESFGDFSATTQFNFNKRREFKEELEVAMSRESKDSEKGNTPEPGLSDFMRMYMEDQRRRDERDRIRREEQERRDEESRVRREEEREARQAEAERNLAVQQRLMEALMTKQAAVVEEPNSRIRLPTMKEGEEMEKFISVFETALKLKEVPRGLWKDELVSHLHLEVLSEIDETLQRGGATYEEIVYALKGGNSVTFCGAAEDLCSGERGTVFELEARPALRRMKHLYKTVAGDACSVDEMAEALAVARMRDHVVPALKTCIDTGKRFGYKDFGDCCEEWVKSQPKGTSCFKKPRLSFTTPARGVGVNQPQVKKGLACFSCGKVGHLARECRSRPLGEAVTAPRNWCKGEGRHCLL